MNFVPLNPHVMSLFQITIAFFSLVVRRLKVHKARFWQ
jgi:hypothetical protein